MEDGSTEVNLKNSEVLGNFQVFRDVVEVEVENRMI